MTANNLLKTGLLILAASMSAFSGFDTPKTKKYRFISGIEYAGRVPLNQRFSFFADSGIEVRLGILIDGQASDEWLAAIKDRMPPGEWEQIKRNKKTLSEAEKKWLHLLENTARVWSSRRQNLQIPFGKTKAPENLVILAGNQGGDDGFTFLDNTICVELAALSANYGDAGTQENRERLLRILDHEYTHLLHHEWFRKHPPDLTTPFARALRDCISEGIGNYRSLSSKWVDKKGALTPHARSTLKELQPIFVDRMTKLMRANENEEEALRQGLSRGQFNKKWGALTVALWLVQETKGDEKKMIKWVERGPKGIIKLAKKYLPAELKSRFLK